MSPSLYDRIEDGGHKIPDRPEGTLTESGWVLPTLSIPPVQPSHARFFGLSLGIESCRAKQLVGFLHRDAVMQSQLPGLLADNAVLF